MVALLPLVAGTVGRQHWSEMNVDEPPSELELGHSQKHSLTAGGEPPSAAADAVPNSPEQARSPRHRPISVDEGQAEEGASEDPNVMGDMARAIWSPSNWPPAGEPGWPAEGQDAGSAKEVQDRTMAGCMEWFLITLLVLCCSVMVALRSREAAAVVAVAAKAPTEASLPALPVDGNAPGTAPHGASGGVEAHSVQPIATPGFASHFSALACAICWRHSHLQAVVVHLLRFALPVLGLVLMHYLRGSLFHEFEKRDWEAVLSGLGISSPAEAVEAIVEYTFTVMLLYLALTGMSNFAWHVAMESETGFRRLLHVSGLSRAAYLTATAGVDGVLQCIVCMGVLALIAQGVLRLRLVVWTSPALVLAILVVLASTTTLLGYLIHFPFRTARSAHLAAQILVMVITFVAPFAPLNPVVPLRANGGQSWKVLALPTLPAYDGLFELARGCAKGRCLVFSDFGPAWGSKEWVYPSSMLIGMDKDRNPTPPVAIICYLGLLSVQLVVGWSVVVLLDRSRLPELHKAAQEPAAASAAGGGLPVLEVRDLVHCYGWLPATTGRTLPGSEQLQDRVLAGVSFSASAGATLGLLGPNGAGKTTAIRCITGEERPTSGIVTIRPASVGGGVDGGPATVGLCPQETVLNEDLTVSENILLFARVRGLSGPAATAAAVHILGATRLQEKHNWMPGTLSGGMRRRLCVACAMVASPAVVILDEPTTGLDPLSRRGIWSTVGEIKAAGGCCMLTTHMLEEAEALCTSLVILRKGCVAAEGSVQKLKEEWGTGYVLNVDVNVGEEGKASKFMAALLPEGCKDPVKVAAQRQLTFKVPGDAHVVGRLFIELAEAAEANGVRHWGISQASLEDAYLRIISEDTGSAC